jgi:hypothetical protein
MQIMAPRRLQRRPLDLLVILPMAIWMSACASPSSPRTETIDLAGVIRDAAQQPVNDVRIEIVGGPFSGRFTTSNAQGRFQFVDPPSVAEPTTLRLSKAGYLPMFAEAQRDRPLILTISAEPSTLPPGDYWLTFTAADACTALPTRVRSRTYSSALNIWETMTGTFSTRLGGSDFFPDLRTISGRNRDLVITFSVYSVEAALRWTDELPIYERLSATEYVSVLGNAKAPLSGVTTSLTATFDGAMAYCARSTDPVASGFPPQCAVPVIECRSDEHQLTVSHR